uniref:MFS transporter n=1 Tax=Toxocara canis TaxID=6265 RepID=A0A183VHE3_TOXCA
LQVTTDDASSNSSDAEGQDAENEADADEGEVSDAQKKVAEAAGLTKQVAAMFITPSLWLFV